MAPKKKEPPPQKKRKKSEMTKPAKRITRREKKKNPPSLPISPSLAETTSASHALQRAAVAEHPLKNVAFVNKLFCCISNDMKTLQTAKNVCKAWKHTAETLCRSVAVPLVLVQDTRMPDGGGEMEGAMKLSQFLKQRKDAKVPHGNFILKNWKIEFCHFVNKNAANSGDINKNFWKKYGKHIRVLTLTGGEVDFIEKGALARSLLSVLPNLEQLTLRNCKCTNSKRGSLNLSEEETSEEEDKEPAPTLKPNDGEASRTFKRIYKNGRFNEAGFRRVHHRYPNLLTRRLVLDRKEPNIINSNNCRARRGRKPQWNHQKLKFICFANVKCSEPLRSPDAWKELFSALPNIEEISLHGTQWIISHIFSAITTKGALVNLSKVDIAKINPFAAERCSEIVLTFPWNLLNLQKLTLDCGQNTDSKDIQNILHTQPLSLKVLHLYRSPLTNPYANLPFEVEMSNLTELHLWGGVSDNLNFLKLTPNLKILKWKASCYTKYNHGMQIHEYLKPKPWDYFFKGSKYQTVIVQNIVKNTTRLWSDFKLESMFTLEIECGPISLESWQDLGSWMPNLTTLKAVVSGDDEFALIGRQWPDMKYLQLAHGSCVTAEKILNTFSTRQSFLSLHRFTWNYCPCLNLPTDEEEVETCAENELKKHVTHTVVVPWRDFRVQKSQLFANIVCLENLFEKAITGGPQDMTVFMNAVGTGNTN